jgi:hypothetical protein
MTLKITDKTQPQLPDHLGGHLNKVHVDFGALDLIIDQFFIGSMIDIGCGPGDMVEYAKEQGLEADGIDGDFTLKYNFPVILHDFQDDVPPLKRTYDLGYSTEFLEHVYEGYQANYMAAFTACKYAVVTYAPPGWEGHHHVCLKPQEYWIDVFDKHGFVYDEETSMEIRKASTMAKGFMGRTGLFFRNRNEPKLPTQG